MSELREKIARAAYEVEVQQFGGFDWEYAKEFSGSNDVPLYELDGAYEIADKILALVAEALLSEDAIEAAEEAGRIQELGISGQSTPFTLYYHEGERAVRAALTAADIT